MTFNIVKTSLWVNKLLRGLLIALAVSTIFAVSVFAADDIIYSDAGLGSNISLQEWNLYQSGFTEMTDPNGCAFDPIKYYKLVWGGGNNWDAWAFVSSPTVNLSSYTNLVFYVKGAVGNETFTIGMLDSSSNKAEIPLSVTVTTNWQMVKIPLSSFKSANSSLNLNSISDPIYFSFTATTPVETVYIDYIFMSNDTTPPAAPTLLQPANGGSSINSPLLGWSNVTDPSGVAYEVQLDTHGPTIPSATVDVSSISATQYTPTTSLAVGTTCWWRVKTTDGVGNVGVWSSTFSFTIAAVETSSPSVPSNVSPANASSSYCPSPVLTWSQVTDVSGVTYKMQIDNNVTFASPLLTVPGVPSNIYSVSPALAAGTYYWRVKAINGVGNQSDYSSYSSFNVVATTWTIFNVLNDQDAAGYVGTYLASGASLNFANDYSTFTTGNFSFREDFGITPSQWAGWFVQEGGSGSNTTRSMATYSSGYLAFDFKSSSADVQIGIRSNNESAGTGTAQLMLGQNMGVLLNNQWQSVAIPISSFTALDANLNLSTMTVYFNAAAVGADIGTASGSFWIDNVRWMSPGFVSPNAQYVLNELENKQSATTGLVRSYETINEAVTYDQALAIMAYCYYGSTVSAQNVLSAYKNHITWDATGGYADEYSVDNWSVLIATRTTGPNLWMLQAIMYYRYMTGDTTYDTMMNNLATWLAARQDADGGLKFGYDGSTWLSYKGTEHNLTGYAVFQNYAQISGDSTFNTKANNIKSWLDTMWGQWNSETGYRFKVCSNVPAIDKALDCYSLAALAFTTGTYNACLSSVDGYFRNSKTSDLTGAFVDGYDFGGLSGQQPDMDAVWLEGTGQMAEAYNISGNATLGAYFTSQIENAISPMGSNIQGLGYATNQGTAYGGWIMDSTHQCVSSAAWYLFAKNQFNPLYPIPLFQVGIYNTLDNSATTYFTWTTPSLPTGWVAANQYIKINCVPDYSNWGIQIYTDNKASNANPKFTGTGNPAGLVCQTATTVALPLAWRCVDITTNTLSVQQGAPSYPARLWVTGLGNQYPCFLWMEDKNTAGFTNNSDYVTVWNTSGIQTAEYAWSNATTPIYIYLAADFANASTPNTYTTNKLTLEFFHD